MTVNNLINFFVPIRMYYFHKNEISLVSAQKECSSTVYKELGNLAKRNPTYLQDSVPLCDRYLERAWYVAFHHDMPTSPPSLTACGTTYPNWLNGNSIVIFINNSPELNLWINAYYGFFFLFSRYIARKTRSIESSKNLWSWFC